jgi:hypothetical protein
MKFNSTPKSFPSSLVQYQPNDAPLISSSHPAHLQLPPSTPTNQPLFPSMLYPPSPHLPNPLRNLNLIPPSPTGSTFSVNAFELQINTNQLLQSPMGPAPPMQFSMPGTPSMLPPQGPPHHQSFHPQQIFWYYPTPPVSPSTQLHYMPPQMFQQSYSPPCVLVVKGAASTITINEILQFFEGYDVSSSFFLFSFLYHYEFAINI